MENITIPVPPFIADASAIVTGDKDLLVLHPFRNISIISAEDFLRTF